MKYVNEKETCTSCEMPAAPMLPLSDVAKEVECTAGSALELSGRIEEFLFGTCSQNRDRKVKETRCLQDSMVSAADTLRATCDVLLHIAGMLGVPL